MAGSKARGVDHAYQEFYRDVLRKNDPALVPYADDGVDVPLMQLVPNERSILHLTPETRLMVAELRTAQRSCEARGLCAAFAFRVDRLGQSVGPPRGHVLREARLQVGAVRLGHYEGVTLAVVDAREIADEGFAVNTILGMPRSASVSRTRRCKLVAQPSVPLLRVAS